MIKNILLSHKDFPGGHFWRTLLRSLPPKELQGFCGPGVCLQQPKASCKYYECTRSLFAWGVLSTHPCAVQSLIGDSKSYLSSLPWVTHKCVSLFWQFLGVQKGHHA